MIIVLFFLFFCLLIYIFAQQLAKVAVVEDLLQMKRLKILYVTHSEAMQGANLALLELMLQLREKGLVEPVVLMPKVAKGYQGNNLYKACQHHGIECYSYAFFRFHNSKRYASYLRCLANVVCYPYVFFKLRKLRVDLVHSNGSVLSLGGYLSRLKKVPHVWHFREAGALHYGTACLLGKRYEKWVYGMGDVFVVISKALQDYYSMLIGAEKLRLVYDGVGIPGGVVLSAHDGDVFQLCMVGLVHPPKNQLDALKALDILVNEWHVTPVHLTIIGYEEQSYVSQLRAFVSEKHLQDHVTFLGERTDVDKLLTGMDVGLMLSRFEAFGRVTVEYMQHGLGVVATATGANAEIVEDGKTGYLVPLGDYHSLADRIRVLMNEKELLSEFSKAGRKKALDIFTAEANARGVYAVYESLFDDSTSTTASDTSTGSNTSTTSDVLAGSVAR